MAKKMWTCRKCRALLEPGTRACPYCGTDQRHHAAPTRGEDERATHRLGIWILGINILVFLLMVVLDPAKGDREGSRLRPSIEALEMFGLSDVGRIKECGQYWRLLTAIFLHLDALHLLLNCFAVLIVTPLAAATFGANRTLCVYVLAGIVGATVSHWQGNSGAGASGALCGMVSALGIYGWRRGGTDGQMLSRRMLAWAIFILVYGFVAARIDNAAHLGGFGAGAVVGWLGAAVYARGGRVDRFWRFSAWVCVLLVVVTVAVWMVPSVLRGFERRDAVVFRELAERRLTQMERVLRGGPRDKLPEAVAEGPRGSEEVRDRLRAALAAVRAGSPEGRAAFEAAVLTYVKWRDSLYCRYGLR